MMRTAFNLLARCAMTAALLVTALASAQVPVLSGTWTFRPLANTASGTPAGRGWVDIIYDPIVRRPVMFGGSGNTYMNDILQIDLAGGRWVEVEPYVATVSPSSPPCPRDEHAVEYDALNQLYWSFGGSGFACSTRTASVGAGSNGNLIVDATLPATSVDFYKDWLVTIQSVVPFYAYATAYNPATRQLTLDRPFVGNPVGLTYSVRPQGGGGTWYYDPATRVWRSFDSPSSGYNGPRPISRLSPGMAYSIVDEAIVMFGGSIYNDTWIIDAQTKAWLQMRSDGGAGNPPRRAQITNSLVYDAGNDVFVLFGGRCAEGSGCGAVPINGRLGDTWIYRLSTNTWTAVTPPLSPPVREQHVLSYDPVHGVVVLFGGNSANGTVLSDVWYYHVPSNSWTQMTPPPGPVARRLHAMVYDPSVNLHVMFGGANSTGASLGDTWTFNLSTQGSNLPPLASFTLNPASGTTATTFVANASTSQDPDGSIVSYSWDFGDAATASGVSASHQYAAAGTYTLTLTVKDNLGATGTNAAQIVVSPASSGAALANAGFESPALSANGYQYQPAGAGWSFGPGTGIQRNGSAWGAALAPQGQQTAFLQGGGAQIAQTLTLPAGTYTISFSAARRAFQGAGQPLQISVDGTNVGTPILPPGTSFSAHTSMPFTVAAGDHTVRFTSTNFSGDNSSFIDAVSVSTAGTQAPAITSSNVASFTVGQAGTFTVQTTGSPVPAIGVSGSLPPGVTFVDNGNGTATLAGTPAANTAGAYPLVFTASNGVGSPATMNFTLTVGNPLPTNTTTTLAASANPVAPGAVVTFTATVTGSNPTGSVGFVADGLPLAGCTLVALSGAGNVRTGACSSSSLEVGSHSVVATYSGDAGNTGSASSTLTLNVSSLATITNGGFEAPTLSSSSFQYQPAGAGWSFGPGTGIQRNGSAWGAALAPQGQQTAFLQGGGAQIAQTLTLPAGTYTISFSAARRAFQGAGQPLQISVDGTNVGTPILPPGTSFSAHTSMPFTVAAGDHTVRFTSTNFSGDNSSFIDAVSVSAAGTQVPAITSSNVASFTVGQAGTFTVQTTGSPVPAIGVSGSLPPGVTFVDNGNGTATLAGIPAANTAGAYPLVFTASNGVGSPATMNFTLTVGNPAAGTIIPMNASFESPVLAAASYQYQPASTGWTFGAGSGVQRNGSAWGASTAPEGQQTAFLQGGGAEIAQTITLPAGTFTVSFSAARRAYLGQAQPLQLTVDGIAVGTPIAPTSTAFAVYTSAQFTVAAGVHTFRFTGTNFAGDNSTFIDAPIFNVLALD